MGVCNWENQTQVQNGFLAFLEMHNWQNCFRMVQFTMKRFSQCGYAIQALAARDKDVGGWASPSPEIMWSRETVLGLCPEPGWLREGGIGVCGEGVVWPSPWCDNWLLCLLPGLVWCSSPTYYHMATWSDLPHECPWGRGVGWGMVDMCLLMVTNKAVRLSFPYYISLLLLLLYRWRLKH